MKTIIAFLMLSFSISAQSLDPARWNIEFSHGMPAHPSALSGMAGWIMQFPENPGFVCYITVPFSASMVGKSAVMFTAQINAEAGVNFRYDLESINTCVFPAHARAIIRQKGGNEFARWWSNPMALELRNGVFTVTTPLDPSQWTSVLGKRGNASGKALKGFKDAISSPQSIGLTFGGGCFFGHGVYVENGSASFILTNYAVQ